MLTRYPWRAQAAAFTLSLASNRTLKKSNLFSERRRQMHYEQSVSEEGGRGREGGQVGC